MLLEFIKFYKLRNMANIWTLLRNFIYIFPQKQDMQLNDTYTDVNNPILDTPIQTQ
jgi:hypothetical protein